MTDIIFIFIVIFILIAMLFFARRFRSPDFLIEKRRYVDGRRKDNLEFINVSIFQGYPSSQMCRNDVTNGLILKLNANTSWQDISFLPAVSGPVSLNCDSIFFTDRQYPKSCFFMHPLLRPIFNNSSVDEKLLLFLEKYRLEIETGKWGAVLVRSSGVIKASEIDEIIQEFKKIDFSFHELQGTHQLRKL